LSESGAGCQGKEDNFRRKSSAKQPFTIPESSITLPESAPNFRDEFAVDLYGAFPVKRLFWVVLRVFCSERERPFFVPSPAIRSPERAEGVKGPKR
jgi:hypothetical protein